MNKKILLFITAITLLLTACSGNENNFPNEKGDQPQSKVQISWNAISQDSSFTSGPRYSGTLDCSMGKQLCESILKSQEIFEKNGPQSSTLIGCDSITVNGRINDKPIDLVFDCNTEGHNYALEVYPKLQDWIEYQIQNQVSEELRKAQELA